MTSNAGGPGEIVADEMTYEACHNEINFRELNKIKVKGRDEPIRVFVPVNEQKTRKNGRSNPASLVGREPEVAKISALLDAFQSDGSGLVCIEGHGGLGKSRLVAELTNMCESRNIKLVACEPPEFESSTVST
jgi:hypothetical protein